MKTVIVVQARMGSTRLPGKILKTVLDKPLLQYQIERLKEVKNAAEIVVATPSGIQEQPIWDLCQKLSIPVVKGSEQDVLSRYYDSALAHHADAVVRVTSDCPLIDPAVVDLVISKFLTTKCDYASNTQLRTYPRGLDVEVFSMSALKAAFQKAKSDFDREHVTPFIWNALNGFRLENVVMDQDQSRHRWTVDTAEDFQLVKMMIEELYPQNKDFTLKDCLDLFVHHPDWENINASVKQKTT